jgi:hypothetical protein
VNVVGVFAFYKEKTRIDLAIVDIRCDDGIVNGSWRPLGCCYFDRQLKGSVMAGASFASVGRGEMNVSDRSELLRFVKR